MAVFRYVELNEPTNRYQIAKGLGMAYTCVKQIMRDLVFVGIIHEKFVLLDNGTQKKVLTIPKEKKDGK